MGPREQILAFNREAERSTLAEEAAQGHCSTRDAKDRKELGGCRIPWLQIDNLVKSSHPLAQAKENIYIEETEKI